MGLRFDPVGGGQFKQLVQQIIENESQPLKTLQARKLREEGKLKLFEEFKTKFQGVDKSINEIASFQKFRELKAELGDGANLVGVTLDKDKAQPGSFTIEIDELAARTSIISNGFENPDEPLLGIGYITMNTLSGESVELFVDEDHSSLRGVANLINARSDSPVRAMVVNDSTESDVSWKLIISAKKDGRGSQIDFPEFYFLDGVRDFYVDADKEAKNALVHIDGFTIELPSNDIVDFLPGVNIHLKQARPGQPFELNITEDYQKISGKIKSVVDQINLILGFINKQNMIDQSTDTRSTFAGDSGLQMIEYRIRNIMHEGFPIGDPETDQFRIIFLNQLGVEFDKTGTLQFKEERFVKMMEKDFEGIAQALTGEFGFAAQLKGLLGGYSRSLTGFLSNRETNIRNRIKEFDRQIESKAQLLERRQQNLVGQFSRLQGSLAAMQKQQAALSAAIPGAGAAGGGNLLASLLGSG